MKNFKKYSYAGAAAVTAFLVSTSANAALVMPTIGVTDLETAAGVILTALGVLFGIRMVIGLARGR